MAPVKRSESTKQVLQELLGGVTEIGLKIGLLLLDRGFCSVELLKLIDP